MIYFPIKSLERNSRLSLANAKNKAEQNYLNIELGHLENEKKIVMRNLQNDKQLFRSKYSKTTFNGDGGYNFSSFEKLRTSARRGPLDVNDESTSRTIGDINSNNSMIDFQKIHNMLFTDDEIDKEKILCLHLVSAHRTESLTPAKRKLLHMCKIHSPLERLLERSKRKNIHQEQKMANMLPIYTIELTEFGNNSDTKVLINDGRLATRILLNEKIRELINTVLTALKQSNPEKNYEIFEMVNDVSCLKKMFTKPKILDFMDDLVNCPLLYSCESFILTAPFRVKSIQLEIRTITGNLEHLVKQIRQNVLQLPTRTQAKSDENIGEVEEGGADARRKSTYTRRVFRRRMSKRRSDEGAAANMEDLYSEKTPRGSLDSEKKMGRHADTNFIQKNIVAAANTKKVEYDTDDDDFCSKRRRSSRDSDRSRRRSGSLNIADRPHLQPITLPGEPIIPEENDKDAEEREDMENKNEEEDIKEKQAQQEKDDLKENKSSKSRRKSSTSDSEHVRIHLKQTTCPACMERYKIPLPAPKTPRVKPSSVIPPAPGENPDLKTNSQNRISMLINKEMFTLQSYERRFSSEENSRRNSLRRKNMENVSSDYLNLSPLELARIEQEIREKETQKKLEKFLGE